MQRASAPANGHRFRRPATLGLAFAAILFGATGIQCDDDAAAAFRQEATSAIGSGVKTILDGVVDGLVAAIEQAGDGTSTGTSQ